MPFQLRHTHAGRHGSTRVYQIVVDSNRRILCVTPGFPGATSDKTMAHSEDYVDEIKRRDLFRHLKYQLLDETGTAYDAVGAYLLTDNGYQR